jgi:class 3 adenylate cyclase
VRVCPNCGEENPERFRLCGFCGTPLATAAPPQETRKTVTIVFSDLKGSTDLGEALDSESLREVMSEYFDAMRPVLERHGGTIEKFIGDAVMAVFGLPRVHEDDALRAVRAAAEMQQALVELNERLARDWGVQLANRTGVNTGEVVAGDPTAGQRLVTGDAVNVAARLEQAAPVMEVLLGELTYRLVREAVAVERMEPLALKGKSEPVPAYRLVAVKPAEKVERDLHVPLVGRVRELRALREAFADAVAARAPRLATLLGDAGMGKSRLIEELSRAVASEARVLRGRCLPYGDGITYWPLAEVVRDAAGVREDDGPDVAAAKLGALAGDEDVRDRIASAIGLGAVPYGVEETFWAARKLFETLAAEQPLVVVFDDVHWAERTFLELVEHVSASARGAPMLVVCSARGEMLEEHEGWGEAAAGVRIELEPLSELESTMVVENLLGQAGLTSDVRRRVIDAAAGNPLFVGQMLSMLVDEGLLTHGPDGWRATADLSAVELPPTIHALLAARLDRLAPDERAVIEPASVIGQEFYAGAVRDLLGEPAAAGVGARLLALTRKQLVDPAGSAFGDESAYRFHHLLIRDAAYRGLLKRARATLHEKFADWLERVAGGRLLEYQEILAYHLEEAYRYRAELGALDDHARALRERAGRTLLAAGRRAFSRGDSPAAANLLRRATELLPEDDGARLAALPDLGEALMDVGELTEATGLLAETVAAARRRGDRRLAADASIVRLLVRYGTDSDCTAEEVRQRAVGAIGDLNAAGDQAGLAKAWRLLAFVHGTAGEFALLERAAQRAIDHARLAGDRRQELRNVSSYVMSALHGPMPAPEAIERCRAIMEQVHGDRRSEGLVLGALGHLHGLRGEFEEARRLHARGKAVLDDLGDRALAATTSFDSSRIEMLAGRPDAAERELRRDYAELEAIGERYFLSTLAGLIAHAALAQGRVDEAERFATAGEELASEDDVSSQALWRTARAKVLAARRDHDGAVALAAEAVELTAATDAVVERAEVLLDSAAVLAAAGRHADARAAAEEALALYRAKGATAGVAHATAFIADPSAERFPG